MKAVAAMMFSVLLAVPATGQDAPSFTSDDEINMQQCIEAVNDTLSADPDSQIALSDCIGTASNVCQDEPEGASTMGIAACNERETSWWDQYLNDGYDQAQTVLGREAFSSLKVAQRAWIAFRDAQCSFEYDSYGDGSMRNIAQTSCMMEQTAERAIELYAISSEGY